jgi:hypothetical protein
VSEQPALQGRSPRRSLARDVQERGISRPMRSVSDAPLPLAKRSGPDSSPLATVQAQVDDETGPSQGTAAGSETVEPTEPDQGAAAQPSPEQVADRVYDLLKRDLRLERERQGW